MCIYIFGTISFSLAWGFFGFSSFLLLCHILDLLPAPWPRNDLVIFWRILLSSTMRWWTTDVPRTTGWLVNLWNGRRMHMMVPQPQLTRHAMHLSLMPPLVVWCINSQTWMPWILHLQFQTLWKKPSWRLQSVWKRKWRPLETSQRRQRRRRKKLRRMQQPKPRKIRKRNRRRNPESRTRGLLTEVMKEYIKGRRQADGLSYRDALKAWGTSSERAEIVNTMSYSEQKRRRYS